jgi:glutathionyl-hydroquinone reductase
VPTLWDTKTKRIVNNESSEIIRMLNSEFQGVAGNDRDFYLQELRAEIDEINAFVYPNINNGVYRCGFARSQGAYDEAYDNLFAALDRLEARLVRRICVSFPRSCASMSPISRSSSATASASRIFRTCGDTPATSMQFRAWRRR